MGISAAAANLNFSPATALDSVGNLYIADAGNNRVRKVAAGTGVITTVAGNGTAGYTGDGSAATSAELNNPQSVALDAAGNLYIADSGNGAIRKVTIKTGVIATFVGNGTIGNLYYPQALPSIPPATCISPTPGPASSRSFRKLRNHDIGRRKRPVGLQRRLRAGNKRRTQLSTGSGARSAGQPLHCRLHEQRRPQGAGWHPV